MLFRQAFLAAVLVSGTAAAAAAQSEEFPFRRFGSRAWIMPRLEMRPYRFSTRDADRIRVNTERLRARLEQRSHDLADRMRVRDFYSRDLNLRLRNREFALRDDAPRRQMELRYRNDTRLREMQDRIRERVRDRVNYFRHEPMYGRRHSRTI
ncbi:MAG TPA: hypothetical protein VFU23_07535 [Gemmatimonadales bacterium]|nr:hypothetical protein [Gemmatimonadales bacterium]